MTQLAAVPFTNIGSVLTTYMLIHHRPNANEWNVVNIELYADPAHTVLLADDIQVAELPLTEQSRIWRALNDWQADIWAARRALKVVPLKAVPSPDVLAGLTWWNALTEAQRACVLGVSKADSAAGAWAWRKAAIADGAQLVF
jgi:hypothetical protein